MTRWCSGPDHAKSDRLEPRDLLPRALARGGRHRGLVARLHSPVEWTKLAVGVGDVGQAPKVEDLARNEGADRDGELVGEADTTV